MRAVLDTDTLVSAIISPTGPPRRLLDAARAQHFELLSSPILITELLDVLMRLKFAARLSQADLSAFGIVSQIWRIATIVTPPSVPRVVIDDPDDDHVLACALTGDAQIIVTGDHDFDPLRGWYHDIRIVSPREAVSTLLEV